MDQTSIYVKSRLNNTVAKKGVKNVPAKANPSDTKRCSLVVTIADDGTRFHCILFLMEHQEDLPKDLLIH
jgi:hypothetical protein